jgi:hypothetical protein
LVAVGAKSRQGSFGRDLHIIEWIKIVFDFVSLSVLNAAAGKNKRGHVELSDVSPEPADILSILGLSGHFHLHPKRSFRLIDYNQIATRLGAHSSEGMQALTDEIYANK